MSRTTSATLPAVLDPMRADRSARPTQPPPSLRKASERLSRDELTLISLGDARPEAWPDWSEE